MSEAGNTGVAGGTKGADPVPEKKQTTAPDNSTALDKDSPLVTTETPPEPPKPVG